VIGNNEQVSVFIIIISQTTQASISAISDKVAIWLLAVFL
jgi:hypothetical protein